MSKEPRLMKPTPEQLAKGGYELPDTRGALAVYTNRGSSYFGRLLIQGAISTLAAPRALGVTCPGGAPAGCA